MYEHNDDVFFIEDFSREDDKIKLIVFDIRAFYRNLSEFFGKDILLIPPSAIGLDEYRNAFCSIEEEIFFRELTVPYFENEELFEKGFLNEFYSINGGKLRPEAVFIRLLLVGMKSDLIITHMY